MVFVRAPATPSVSADVSGRDARARPMKSIPGQTAAISAVSAENVTLESPQEQLARQQGALNANRQHALQDIYLALLEVHYREIDSFLQGELAKLNPEKSSLLTKALGELRASIVKYSKIRGPLAARLALLASFPDRDPRSIRPPDPGQVRLSQAFLEAKALRTRLKELDSQFMNESKEIFSRAEAEHYAALTALRVRIEELRADADIRASLEAERQLSSEPRVVSTVAGATAKLPAVGGKSVSLRSSQGPISTAAGILNARAQPGLEFEKELQLFLKTHDYDFSQLGPGVRDATQEFLDWRKERQVGP